MAGKLRKLCFGGWCAGWLVVAYLCLTPLAVQFPASDKVEHLVGYAIVTLAAASFARGTAEFLRMALAAVLLSTLLELGQLAVPGRLFELADLAANYAGITLGWLVGSGLLWLLDRRIAAEAGRV